MSTPTPTPAWPYGPPTPAQIDTDVKAVGVQVAALAKQVAALQQSLADATAILINIRKAVNG